jgi:hypothetical protein
MTTIYCSNTDCVYYDVNSFTCKQNAVTIGDGYTYGCVDFINYADNEEYSNEHYIAVKAEGEVAKAVVHGKKFEINGITFYTRDRTDNDDYRLTHGRTGYDVGTKERLMSCWDKFLEYEKKIPDVETLPLAEENAVGKYELVKEGVCDKCGERIARVVD